MPAALHEPSWRKMLLLQRSALEAQWDKHFPRHEFATGRLRPKPRRRTNKQFNEAVERGAASRAISAEVAFLRRLLEPNVSLDRAWNALNDRRRFSTPQVVIEAIIHSVREHGIAALDFPVNQQRLALCSDHAKAEVIGRITSLEAANG